MEKVGPHQLALDVRELSMRREGVLHVVGARRECREEVAVAALEILEHFSEQALRLLEIQPQYAIDDMIGASSCQLD